MEWHLFPSCTTEHCTVRTWTGTLQCGHPVASAPLSSTSHKLSFSRQTWQGDGLRCCHLYEQRFFESQIKLSCSRCTQLSTGEQVWDDVRVVKLECSLEADTRWNHEPHIGQRRTRKGTSTICSSCLQTCSSSGTGRSHPRHSCGCCMFQQPGVFAATPPGQLRPSFSAWISSAGWALVERKFTTLLSLQTIATRFPFFLLLISPWTSFTFFSSRGKSLRFSYVVEQLYIPWLNRHFARWEEEKKLS